MVTVSVIIPTYNRADVIERAIDSALAQTLTDIEVIVVDDASTDNTSEILERIDDPRVTYIEHEENRGGSAARNTGISRATGEYIAFLDSDDGWKPTKLEQQVEELESRSSEWVAAYCDFHQKRTNPLVELVDNHIRRPTGLEGDDELIDRLLLRKFAHGGASTLLVKRDAVEEINGFDESFQRNQDLEFLIRLLQIGKLAYVDDTLMVKYDTGNPDASVALEAMEQFHERFDDLITARGHEHRVSSIRKFMAAKIYFSEGKFRKGFELLRKSECPHYRDAVGIVLAITRGARNVV